MHNPVNSPLSTVNRIYLQMQQMQGGRSEFEVEQDPAMRDEYLNLLTKGVSLFNETAPQCTTDEIIEAYYNGTEILQRNVSGYMSSPEGFDPAYIPVMKKAIRNDGLDNLYHFLHALKRKIPLEELTPLLLAAMESKYPGVKRGAISVIGELSLTELLPQVIALQNDPNENVALEASFVVDKLRSPSASE